MMAAPMPLHVAREVAKNLVKGAFPTLVTRLRRHTGRGRGQEPPEQVLAYCRQVFAGYAEVLGAGADPEAAFADRVIVEIGPGDTLAVGLLFIAHGARRYLAADRFSFAQQTAANTAIYGLLR